MAKSKVKLQSKSEQNPVLQVDGTENGVAFKNWGTTFNELCWDALGLLTRTEQDEILYNIFSPQGDLRITRGRISMGANDYARSWYSCDEVEGDFELRYFNINRDKQTIIPFIRAAQNIIRILHLDITLVSSKLDENKWRLSGFK